MLNKFKIATSILALTFCVFGSAANADENASCQAETFFDGDWYTPMYWYVPALQDGDTIEVTAESYSSYMYAPPVYNVTFKCTNGVLSNITPIYYYY
jgi:hypothetical protein